MRIHPRLLPIFRGLLIAAFALPLLTHAYVSTFTRYLSDDYCSAADAKVLGVIEATRANYIAWSGRYAYLITIHSLSALGPQVARFAPSLLIAAFVISLIWVFDQLWQIVGALRRRFLAVLFGTVTAFAIITGTPFLFQSVYWITGALTYLLPLVLWTIYAGLSLSTYRQGGSRLRLGVGVLVAFYASGLSETSTALQVILLGLAILLIVRFVPIERKRQMLIWLGAGLFVTLLGLLIILLAPGNTARQALFPERAPIPMVALRLVPITLAFITSDVVFFSPLPLLVAFVVAFFGAARTPLRHPLQPMALKGVRQLLLVFSVVMVGLVTVCMLPSVYVLSAAPPARAYLIPHFVLVWTALAWGWVMGLGVRRPAEMPRKGGIGVKYLLVIGVVAVVSLASAIHTLSITQDYPIFAAEWDARDQFLKQAAANGDLNPRVPPLAYDIAVPGNLVSLTDDPLVDFNLCVARYYGLESAAVADMKDGF